MKLQLACKIIQLKYSKGMYIFLQETEIIAEDLTADSKAIFPLALSCTNSGPY